MAPKDIMTDETQLRHLIDDWADAVRAKDIDRVMSHYAPDVLAFDAIAQLQFKGADAIIPFSLYVINSDIRY